MGDGLSKIWLSIQYSSKLNRDSSGCYIDINGSLLDISKKYNIWYPHKDGYCISLDGFRFPIFYCPEDNKIANKNDSVLRFGRAGYYGDLCIDDNRYDNYGGFFGLTENEEKILYISYSIFDRKDDFRRVTSIYIWFDVYDDSIYPGITHLKKKTPPDIAYLNPYEKNLSISYIDDTAYVIDIHRDGRVVFVKEPKLGKEYESLWIG